MVRIAAMRTSIAYREGTVDEMMSGERERVLVLRSRAIRGVDSNPGDVMRTVGRGCGKSGGVERVRRRRPAVLLLSERGDARRAPWKRS